MCGGTGIAKTMQQPGAGLSPRVRGNPPGPPPPELNAGSIPACAGEPQRRQISSGGGGVYPRVCGGTRGTASGAGRVKGLSPRVRGNRRRPGRLPMPRGSIPACAGEPPRPRARVAVAAVYPRVCGGTQSGGSWRNRGQGLSPRVRGNRDSAPAGRVLHGSIPACAGEPPRWRVRMESWGVYPRVCGGTLWRSAAIEATAGLSPRVRGNRRLVHHPKTHQRSIPACAGEPLALSLWPRAIRVYPRVCGGTRRRPRPVRSVRGLSPRVRGNLGGVSGAQDFTGSIPACAGEPVTDAMETIARTVYPRVCGGTVRLVNCRAR